MVEVREESLVRHVKREAARTIFWVGLGESKFDSRGGCFIIYSVGLGQGDVGLRSRYRTPSNSLHHGRRGIGMHQHVSVSLAA